MTSIIKKFKNKPGRGRKRFQRLWKRKLVRDMSKDLRTTAKTLVSEIVIMNWLVAAVASLVRPAVSQMVVKAGVCVEARYHTNVAVEVKNLSSKIKRCNSVILSNIIHVCFLSLLLFNYLSKHSLEKEMKKRVRWVRVLLLSLWWKHWWNQIKSLAA